jgi:hypothetical protein
MKIEHVIVTPEMAAELLKKNTENFRRPECKRVALYAEEMQSGNWADNGDTIKLNGDILLDGQHRLMAVVRSGCSVPMIIVSGIKASAATIDRGKPRSIASWLSHDGFKNANVLASSARLCICHQKGFWTKAHQLSQVADSELIKFIADNNESLQSAIRVSGPARLVVPHSMIASVVFLGCDGPAEESEIARWFCERIADGTELTKADAVYYLRNKFIESKGASIINVIARAYITMAWNKTVRGEACNPAQMRITYTGPNTTKLPEVIEKAKR